MSVINIHHASCLDWLAQYAIDHAREPQAYPLFDSCVCDPPYHLSSIVKRFGGANASEAKVGATGAYARAARGFMGKEWDGGDIAFRPETWEAVYRVLKPGAHLVAFSGTRTYHHMAVAIDNAGFEIRDQLQWLYGSGFPKSHDVSKGIDRAAGAARETIRVTNVRNPKAPGGGRDGAEGGARPWIEAAMERGYHEKDGGTPVTPEAEQWQGWGTALKPALEPICLARKPLSEKTIAANVLKWGTGAINVDATRINAGAENLGVKPSASKGWKNTSKMTGSMNDDWKKGRWPANLLHDNSDEVLAGFPSQKSGENKPATKAKEPSVAMGNFASANVNHFSASNGSAARFFYSAKAGPLDRIGTAHATVKPVDVMRWLARLVTPPGGHILEPFAGSGTTGIAAMAEGFDCTMIELMAEHVSDIERKLAYLRGEGALKFQEHNHAKSLRMKEEPLGGLFGGAT